MRCRRRAESRSGLVSERRLAGGGFTLVECLVTLVLVATAAAITLAHVRTLFDIRLRYQTEQREAARSLNEVALMRAREPSALRLEMREGRLEVRGAHSEERIAEVRNLVLPGEPAVPVDQAFTPFQLYRAPVDTRYPISLIIRSLPPPPS